MWGWFLSRSSCCWLWSGLGFHPDWYHWDTRVWHILQWAWCCYIFSLFGILPLSTISDTFKLQLTPSIRSCKLWCQARVLLVPLPLATKMSVSKLICYFSSYPAAFGFWSSTPLDNITLTSANRNADHSIGISDWYQCCCSCSSRSTCSSSFLASEVPLLILFPVPNSEGGVIPVSEVHQLLIKVHNMLDNALSKWVGNSAHI